MEDRNNYIDNDKMFRVLCEFLDKRKTDADTPIPEYLGECILQIAQNLAKRPNFAGYTFREDLVGDGVESCIRYIDRFNPDYSNNPFAYFTQICWFAFLRRIRIENQYFHTRENLIQSRSDNLKFLSDSQNGDTRDYSNPKMHSIVSDFEKTRSSTKTNKISPFPPHNILTNPKDFNKKH